MVAVWWSKGDLSFLFMRVYVYLKIMTPQGKQDYVRHITERAREFMESRRKRKRKKMVENERAGERKRGGGSGIKSKVKKKKRRGWNPMGMRVWWTKCKRKKKKNVWMKERQRIRNHNLKYYYNIFTINFK